MGVLAKIKYNHVHQGFHMCLAESKHSINVSYSIKSEAVELKEIFSFRYKELVEGDPGS